MEPMSTDDAAVSLVRRAFGRRVAVVAVGSLLALGGGGIAYAATTEATPAPSGSATTEDVATTAPDSTAPDEMTPPGGQGLPVWNSGRQPLAALSVRSLGA